MPRRSLHRTPSAPPAFTARTAGIRHATLCRFACAGLAAAIVTGLVVAAPLAAQPFNWAGISDRTLHVAAHLIVWTFLGGLLAVAMGRWCCLAWPMALLLAAAEEWHQGFVPGRTVDINDWWLNAVAVTAAVVLVIVYRLMKTRMRERPVDPHGAAVQPDHMFAVVTSIQRPSA